MIKCDYHLFTQNFLKKLSSAILIKMEILLSDKSLYTPKDSVVSCQLKKTRDNVVGSMNSTNQVRDFHFKTSRSSGNCLEQESSFGLETFAILCQIKLFALLRMLLCKKLSALNRPPEANTKQHLGITQIVRKNEGVVEGLAKRILWNK